MTVARLGAPDSPAQGTHTKTRPKVVRLTPHPPFCPVLSLVSCLWLDIAVQRNLDTAYFRRSHSIHNK